MKNSIIMSISRREERQANYGHFKKRVFPIMILILFLCVPYTVGTPPNYKSFKRNQRIDYQPNPDNLMRIWIAYVGQGDGILIQLPPKCNYDSDSGDNVTSRTETVDIMIDGGSHSRQNETLMENFLLRLYDAPVTIEHAVLTHHDSDHVLGLTHILNGNPVGVESIYHNGLASYQPGKRDFVDPIETKQAIFKRNKKKNLTRGMAFLDTNTNSNNDGYGKKLDDKWLVTTKTDLRTGLDNEDFQGLYEDLAQAIIEESPETKWFARSYEDGPFIKEREAKLNRGVNLNGIKLELIWPLKSARKYGDWGETINGNSVTFRLEYGDFSMLFTGDHNEKSQKKLIERLEEKGKSELLNVDVFKVPHHGSGGKHVYEQFYQRRDENDKYIRPVLSVASMGEQGFKSKKLKKNNWQHPDPKVISWLGGSHRVYHTLIEEKKFRWENLTTLAKHKKMYEAEPDHSHILIETDGQWFRIVEIDAGGEGPLVPRTVKKTPRGDGTRWIKAN